LPVSANPYVWRAGITDPAAFFDREREQRLVRDLVTKRQNCQLVGARRMGKTSLLFQVQRAAQHWESAITVAHLDLQDPRCSTLAGWLASTAHRFNWPKAPSTLTGFIDHVDALLARGLHPVLCLDEFEEFTLPNRRQEFTRDFFATLRCCSQRGLSILTSSRRCLSELTDPGDPTSPFYNTFAVLRLGRFSEDDAEDFVALHRSGVPQFTADERRHILAYAAGDPLALQVACYHVLNAKLDGESTSRALARAADEMRALRPRDSGDEGCA
jgi:hypothetical protein